MARAELVRDELRLCGIEYLVWLPDSETRSFYDSIFADPQLHLVQVCREDEVMGIYGGLYLGGKKAAVLIQNTGLYNSMDALRGVILNLKLPLLLMVGYRGYRGMVEGKPTDTAAIYLEPVLEAMGIKHYLLDRDEEVENISRAYREAHENNKPVAVLIGKEYQ